MSKKIELTPDDRAILDKLPTQFLAKMVEIKQGKEIQVWMDLMNKLIEEEKEYFVTTPVTDEKVLLRKHAAFQGGVFILKRLLRLIASSENELSKRDEDNKKRRE